MIRDSKQKSPSFKKFLATLGVWATVFILRLDFVPGLESVFAAAGISFPVPPGDLQPYELKRGERPLPKAQVIYSSAASLDAMYRGIYSSYKYETRFPQLVKTGVDLNKAEIEEYLQVIRSQPAPGASKNNLALFTHRYRIGDSRFTDMLLEAVKEGFGSVIIGTDLNESMDPILPEGVNRTSDFNNPKVAQFKKNNDEAREIKRLLEAGFVICGSQHQFAEVISKIPDKGQVKVIFSQPLYKVIAGRSKPIQHEKQGGIFETKRRGTKYTFVKGLVALSSSHNMTLPPNAKIDPNGNAQPFYRANILESFLEQNIMQHTFAHILTMARGLGAGREIKDVDSITPVSIVAKNGEVISIYHTDGKFNPNHFDSSLFDAGVADPQNYKFQKIYYSEFVYTFSESLRSLRALMKAQGDVTLLGVFDSQFINSHGFGLAAALAGYLVIRPFGQPVYPFGFETRKRMEVYGYQRPAEGLKVEDPSGPPTAVVLNHNKFMAAKLQIHGVDRIVYASGSLNLSGHFDNAERRDIHLASQDSVAAQGMIEAVEQLAKGEIKTGFALPLHLAVFRLMISDLLKRSFDDVPAAMAQDWFNKLNKEKGDDEIYDGFEKAVLELEALPTSVKNKATRAQVQETLVKIKNFAKWYSQKYERGLYVNELVSFAAPILFPDTSPETIRSVISFLVNRPYGEVPKEELERRIKEVWVELKIDKPLPQPFSEYEFGLIRTPTPSESNPRILRLAPLCDEALAAISAGY